MHSFLGVPIMIAGCVRGNLYLTGKADGAFTEQDELATVILAGWAAIAIENARLREISEQRRQRAERATRALEIVRDATVATGAEPDLTRVLVLIASGTREVVSAASAAIWLRDGGELVVHAAAGPDSASASGGRIDLDSEFVRALKLGRTLRVASTSAGGDVILAQALGVADVASALLVPMTFRGQLLGLLVAVDDVPGGGGFTDEDEDVLGAFAASAATAVAVAHNVTREHVRSELAAAEAERTCRARELHDETLDGLRMLRMLLTGTQRQCDGAAPTRHAIKQAVDEVDNTIAGLRARLREPHPDPVSELGLPAALEALLDRHRRWDTFELTGQIRLRDPAATGRRLAPEVESIAYQLVQESLTNIVQHAEARQVRVTARESSADVTIEISDDGRGFEPDEIGPGFGLIRIRECVALAVGDLTITSGPHGTLLRACLPLTPGIASAAPGRPRHTDLELGAQDLRAWVRRYGDAMRAADARGAVGIARDALAAGLSLPALHARVITPAMYWIGELWAQEALTVADEHAATAISHDVLASIKDPTHNDPPVLGETVLLAAPGGEQHGLGLKMAADVLESAGYHVVYLGVDVPIEALIQTVATYRPALTGVSLTMPRPSGEIQALIDAIAAANPDAGMLIAGQGVPEWLRDDRVTYIASVETLVAQVERILTRRPITMGA